VVVATYESASWIPYFFQTFGANADKVDAVATAGVYGPRAWNSPRPCFYSFNEAAFTHNPANANFTMERVKSVVRSSVIHADLLHNHWHQRLKAAGKRLLSVTGIWLHLATGCVAVQLERPSFATQNSCTLRNSTLDEQGN
jgi:hypothetical protein